MSTWGRYWSVTRQFTNSCCNAQTSIKDMQRRSWTSVTSSPKNIRPSNLLHRGSTNSRPCFHTSSPNSANYQYQRFNQAQGSRAGVFINLFRRWAAHPQFYVHLTGLGAAGGGFYVYNLETVAVSGRKRFNVIPSSYEKEMASEMYKQVMQEYRGQILSATDARHRMVQDVLDRLTPSAAALGMGEKQEWEVHVIDAPKEYNAFVIPGGKVFVFSGILPICAGKDGLAAVLGHELAHVLARHSAERMSQLVLILPLIWGLSFFLDVSSALGQTLADLVFQRPGSRRQESEADYIGLLMMARSCFDPEAALGVWQRMQQMEQVAIPQFLSTHPTNKNRYDKIKEWLPEANERLQEAGCAITTGYARQFQEQTGLMTSEWRSTD